MANGINKKQSAIWGGLQTQGFMLHKNIYGGYSVDKISHSFFAPQEKDVTLPETNMAHENGWLEDFLLSFWGKQPILRGKLAVSFRDGRLTPTGRWTFSNQIGSAKTNQPTNPCDPPEVQWAPPLLFFGFAGRMLLLKLELTKKRLEIFVITDHLFGVILKCIHQFFFVFLEAIYIYTQIFF